MGLVDSTIESVKTNIGTCVCIEGNSTNSSGEDSDPDNTSYPNGNTKDSNNPNINSMEFQHSASSDSAEEPIPLSIEDAISKAKSGSLIPESTKIIIYLSNLIANIMKEYFESPANQCEFNPINIEGILSNILITGDTPRNYLLNIAMNNTIDIIINTRELTKLHLNHLQTYHSTKEQQMEYSQCILWHHYSNKFNNINKNDIVKDINSYEYISKASYILNAKFITSILIQSIQFENKLSVYYNPNVTNGYHIQIIDTIDDIDQNLDAQNVHIFDLKHRFCGNISDTKKNDKIIKKYHAKSRKQLTQFKNKNNGDMMDHGNNMHMRLETRRIEENNYMSKAFHMPKYKYKLSKIIMDNYDISLDFFVLPLSDIIDCKDTTATGGDNQIDFDWKQKIKCGVENYNSFNDLEKQIITHPNIEKIIKIYTPYILFFDIIRMSLQCVQYTIDEKLIKICKSNYKRWILNEEFLEEEANFVRLVKTLFDEKLCCSWLDFKTMLETFQLFNFNNILIGLSNKSIDFKEVFVDKLNEQDQDVVDLFEEYQYPID